MLPSTTTRVEQHTDEAINERIRRRTEQDVARVAEQGHDAINQRLDELEFEWDMERALEANAASIGLLGLGLGAFMDRRWFIVPTLVAGFLFQHAMQGWCPPVPILRRMGFRTAREIALERYALKALRGDFVDLSTRVDLKEPGHIRTLIKALDR